MGNGTPQCCAIEFLKKLVIFIGYLKHEQQKRPYSHSENGVLTRWFFTVRYGPHLPPVKVMRKYWVSKKNPAHSKQAYGNPVL